MADVDFSNAVIEPLAQVLTPTSWGLWANGLCRLDSRTQVTSSFTKRDVKLTLNEYSVGYSGQFSEAGTEFALYTGVYDRLWKVSNISFQAGDTFNFIIDTTLTVS